MKNSSTTVATKSSLQWEGWVCEGRDFQRAEKLSKGPEVGHNKVGTSIACLEMRKLIDLAEG